MDEDTNTNSNQQPIEPEMIDVRETPQYKEYEAQQVAGSGLLFEDNPALKMQGNVSAVPDETVEEAVAAVEQMAPVEPVEPVSPEQPVAAEHPVVTEQPVAPVEQMAPVEPVSPEQPVA
ncbi:hypothetical protein COV81_01970, partial [Candidatus Peregrinibacteria bacterium CG11_big_fil_rev_8_21_14_0_20_41_10]